MEEYLESSPRTNAQEFSVSEISNLLKKRVEDAFPHVRVRGEISGFKRAASGHLYFDLKDEGAVMNAVCWRGVAGHFKVQPEEGMEVVVTGKITTYQGSSRYQIVVERLEPAGAGALMALLEARKKQLAAEGLFNEERKKPIPYLPKVIGVVTSPTGAVIRDILHRIGDRFPCHVLVWPVLVQGENAKEQITKAIQGFNAITGEGNIPRPDLLIVARGGGSIEDLWAFNEEMVVRAAAASEIPLISAVGHETDTTLIDFASDRRAPTPTAAAEMAVPVKADLVAALLQMAQRLFGGISRELKHKTQYVEGLARGLISPQKLLENMTQRLDDWSERLTGALPKLLNEKQQRLALLAANLRPALIQRDITARAEKVAALARLLESYHYKKVLARGFALVRDEKNQLITSVVALTAGTALTLEMADGSAKAHVDGEAPNKKAAAKKAAAPTKPSGQGDLF